MTTTATPTPTPTTPATTGGQLLKDMIVFSKYARYNHEEKRRETTTEVLARYENMMTERFPSLKKHIKTQMKYVYDGQVVPSMRALQFAGPAIETNNNRMYNCAYMPIDHIKGFSELMYLLLGGTGVGYSVQLRHVCQLPPVLKHPDRKPLMQWTIADSIEGWAEAISRLMGGWTDPRKPFYIFDYDLIRPAGTEIKTAGGFAPGPEPLRETIQNITRILASAKGGALTPLMAFDICCYIAQAVYSGGIRRAATIALFDRTNHQMKLCKTGDWYSANPQRSMANISVVLPREEVRADEFRNLFDITRASNSGEPGFFWTNDPDIGCNPCGEISLRPFSFCNLSEVSVAACKDEEQFINAVGAASFFGTLQADFTDLRELRPIWKQTTEEDRLVGVSLTGIASYEVFPFSLEKAAQWAVEVNKETAASIGIEPAKRITTLKPSGTASLYFGTSSGIHPFHAPFYIRRMRVKEGEALLQAMRQFNPQTVEPDQRVDGNFVISIPVASPPGCITNSERALDMLRRIRQFYHEWILPGHLDGTNTNNISATVYVRSSEWDGVKQWLWENRFCYQGITVLPYSGSTYPQMPFEEISSEVYNQLSDQLKAMDFHLINELEDHTNPGGEVACSGGACEVSWL